MDKDAVLEELRGQLPDLVLAVRGGALQLAQVALQQLLELGQLHRVEALLAGAVVHGCAAQLRADVALQLLFLVSPEVAVVVLMRLAGLLMVVMVLMMMLLQVVMVVMIHMLFVRIMGKLLGLVFEELLKLFGGLFVRDKPVL